MADHPTLYALVYDPTDATIIKLRNDLGQEFTITKDFLSEVALMLADDYSDDAESAEAVAAEWQGRAEEIEDAEPQVIEGAGFGGSDMTFERER